jgi:hypothetical protein
MKLMTKEQERTMLENGRTSAKAPDKLHNPKPVVKLFTPWGAATWLLTELDPKAPDIAFGLCDLGMGFPELGSVCISELEAITGPLGLKVERDRFFEADKALLDYAKEARFEGRIKA